VLLGVLAGIGLIAWGQQAWRRKYQPSAYALAAVGNGAILLSFWASFALYHLLPSGVAFAGMAMLVVWDGFDCWQKDSPLLAAYALAAGFLVPLLLSSGANHEIQLFSYLLLLDAAVALLAAAKAWAWPLPVSAFLTLIYGVAWAGAYWDPALGLLTCAFIFAFTLLFLLAARHSAAVQRSDDTLGQAVQLTAVALPVLTEFAAFILTQAALRPFDGTRGPAWPAFLLAGIAGGFFWFRDSGDRPPITLYRHAQAVAALALATAAIGLALHGHALSMAWLIEALGLLGLAAQRPSATALRGFGLACALLGVARTVAFNPYRGATVVANPRFATYLAAIIVCGLVAYLARRCAASAGDEFEVAPLIRWRPLALGMGLTASVLLWLAVMLEITTWWWGAALPGQLRIYQVEAFRQGSQFSYSIWTMLFGAGLILTGFWRRLPTLRWEGLVALALAIGKVFVWDTADLSQGYRIACFLGLGALLLGISFVYQRDWLNLRRTESGD